MDCFNAVKLNESVISYINRCDIDLDFSKAEYDEDTKGRLFDSVIICNDIDNSKYKQILVSLKGLRSYIRSQQKIYSYRYTASQYGKNELS